MAEVEFEVQWLHWVEEVFEVQLAAVECTEAEVEVEQVEEDDFGKQLEFDNRPAEVESLVLLLVRCRLGQRLDPGPRMD